MCVFLLATTYSGLSRNNYYIVDFVILACGHFNIDIPRRLSYACPHKEEALFKTSHTVNKNRNLLQHFSWVERYRLC